MPGLEVELGFLYPQERQGWTIPIQLEQVGNRRKCGDPGLSHRYGAAGQLRAHGPKRYLLPRITRPAPFAVVAEPDDLAGAMLARFGDVLDRIGFNAPYRADPDVWQRARDALHAGV